MKPFRKTTQILAPGTYSKPAEGFDLYPAQSVAGEIGLGFPALARQIAAHPRVIVDGMGGVLWEDFRVRLTGALAELGVRFEWINIESAWLPEVQVDSMIAPFLGGDDPLFGTRNPQSLRAFFQPDQLRECRAHFMRGEPSLLYGTGAALAAAEGFLIYLDVPKNEIQFRSRAGSISNLGTAKAFDPKLMYKRFYFVDWPALRRHQAELAPRLDLIADVQRPDEPAFLPGEKFRRALAAAARTAFRVRPWFEPGPWGGQWMKSRFAGLPPEAPNLAWSFELISPENGLAFTDGKHVLEAAFDWLMVQAHREVLGNFAGRFGAEFPIRFDYLDTFAGGNLSLQCHPRPDYAWRHFGERFTQDETYYIVDCVPGAKVFCGFATGAEPRRFEGALRKSQHEASPFDVAEYVQTHDSEKHTVFLIPHGTIHCSGKNNLVLEISATPYIFTFKMYDWMRLDLDGRPRPLNIERALENLCFERKGEQVQRELISRPRVLASDEDWKVVHLPTHPAHFYDLHRLEFPGAIRASTQGSPHVLNLVEGASVVLEIPGAPPRRFAGCETFVVPAATGDYRLRSPTGQRLKVLQAFLKPEAAHA